MKVDIHELAEEFGVKVETVVSYISRGVPGRYSRKNGVLEGWIDRGAALKYRGNTLQTREEKVRRAWAYTDKRYEIRKQMHGQ